MQWSEETGAEVGRNPNGILSVLVKHAFPGNVTFEGRDEPAFTWPHYQVAEDTNDEGGIQFDNCLQRVEESFWWWFRWPQGKEADARRVVRKVVKGKITQMIYEGRIQAIICFYTQVLGQPMKRAEACQIQLTVDEYMKAIPWWSQRTPEAWQKIAELKWCNEEWKVKSQLARECRQMMEGVGHRQGSASLARYKKKKEREEKRPISDVEAYVSGRRGEQEGTLCNPRATENVEAYTDAAREMHGLDFDVMNSPIDGAAVYKAGKGKKHGHFMLGDGYISTATTLSDVRTSSSVSQDDVHPHRRPRIDRIAELEAKLEEQIQRSNRFEAMLLKSMNNGRPDGTLASPEGVGAHADTSGSTAAHFVDGHARDATHHASSPLEVQVGETIPPS